MSAPRGHTTGSSQVSQGMPSRSRIRKVPSTQLAAPGVGCDRIQTAVQGRQCVIHWRCCQYTNVAESGATSCRGPPCRGPPCRLRPLQTAASNCCPFTPGAQAMSAMETQHSTPLPTCAHCGPAPEAVHHLPAGPPAGWHAEAQPTHQQLHTNHRHHTCVCVRESGGCHHSAVSNMHSADCTMC
jgi:hypothetical protein